MKEKLSYHIVSHSPEDTERLGASFGSRLRGGEVVELVSDLGGGKTTFVRGVARGMGCVDRVTSPTFTVAREYMGQNLTLFHFDFYRLDDAGLITEELAEHIKSPHAVVMVEWGDIVRSALPVNAVSVTIRPTDESEREITISYNGSTAYLIADGE